MAASAAGAGAWSANASCSKPSGPRPARRPSRPRRAPAQAAKLRDPSPANLPMTAAPTAEAASRPTVFAALAAVYLVWGSTYFAIRIALEGFPPFALAAIRFLIAGGGLYAFLRLRGAPAPTRTQWRNAALTGVLLLGLGNGLVCYAEQSVASGIAAVAVASVTLFAAVFSALYGDWPRRSEWLGVLVGLAGVLILNFGGDLRAAPLG